MQIMLLLVRRHAEVVRRSALEAAAWGLSEAVTPNALDVALHRIRRKLLAIGSRQRTQLSAPRNPSSGWVASSRIIFGIAMKFVVAAGFLVVAVILGNWIANAFLGIDSTGALTGAFRVGGSERFGAGRRGRQA